MRHFFNMLQVTVLPDGEVLLAVRVSDTKVDQYRFSVEVFREMVAAYHRNLSVWSGPDGLLVKVDTRGGLASIAVPQGENKREIHRIGLSQFEAMAAQFRAQDRELRG